MIDGSFASATAKVTTYEQVLAAIQRPNSVESTNDVLVAFNLYKGPKNMLLYALMDTVQKEDEPGLNPQVAFAREDRNNIITRIAANHADKDFDFLALEKAILEATGGNKHRGDRAIDAWEQADARWTEQEEAANSATATQVFALEAK